MNLLTRICFISGLLPGSLLAAAELPDPTRPADYSDAPLVVEMTELPGELINWNVTAIRISGDYRSAIVNGHLVREGDSIGMAEILEIKPVSVSLIYDNKQLVLKLFNDVVEKKTVNSSN